MDDSGIFCVFLLCVYLSIYLLDRRYGVCIKNISHTCVRNVPPFFLSVRMCCTSKYSVYRYLLDTYKQYPVYVAHFFSPLERRIYV